jgi:uncharacterized protein
VIERIPEIRSLSEAASNPAVVAFAERFLTRQPLQSWGGYDDHRLAEETALLLRGNQDLPPSRQSTFRAFVLKTVTDCNFRCQYPCYEYVNDAWRNLPPVMPDDIVAKVGRRIGAHAMAADLAQVGIVFHGGEPLFMRRPERPEEYYSRIIPLLLNAVRDEAPDTEVKLDMQTNGVLLRPPILDVLSKYNVGVGVSLDGPQQAHDAHRLTRNGAKGTHRLVLQGLEQLSEPAYRHLARSILCVINIDSDPLEVDSFLREKAPPTTQYIDYLLPYATPDNPPRQPADPARRTATPYADWLLPIFWRSLPSEAPYIRLFTSIMQLALGRHSSTEAIGPDAGEELVIRTNGDYEPVDALNATAPAELATSMGVDTHSIEDVAELLRRAGHLGKKPVAAACSSCEMLAVCGGGHIASRYSTERQFDNASAYCGDLLKLTSEISRMAQFHTRLSTAAWLQSRGVPRDDSGCC